MDGRTGTDARIDKTKTQQANIWTARDTQTDGGTGGRMHGQTGVHDTQKDKKADETNRLIG